MNKKDLIEIRDTIRIMAHSLREVGISFPDRGKREQSEMGFSALQSIENIISDNDTHVAINKKDLEELSLYEGLLTLIPDSRLRFLIEEIIKQYEESCNE